MQKLIALKEKVTSPQARKIAVWATGMLIVAWVLFRIVMIILMGRQTVFNTARVAEAHGVPVAVQVMQVADGVINTPIAVRGNVAYVSGSVAATLRAGMKIGDGEIVSVGAGIDLDSGMHVVRTRGVSDGLQMAVYRARGFFVPAYAVRGDTVMVVNDGVAAARTVKVARMDSENALITDGIAAGDMVVLSHVDDGAKVKVVKQ